MPFLLVQGAEIAFEVDACRERQDRADLLLLARHQPAAARRDPLEGGEERVRGRIAGAEAAQVHDVPARGILVGEGRDDGIADLMQIRGCREDRGVVGVV